MSYIKKIILLLILILNFNNAFAFINEKINFTSFYLNKYEVTISEFKEYALKNNIITEAEKTGVSICVNIYMISILDFYQRMWSLESICITQSNFPNTQYINFPFSHLFASHPP